MTRAATDPDGRSPVHVAVVGGGISGLAAAFAVRRARPDLRITVLEQSGGVGGKLRVSDVGGVPVDEGAESLLLRRPEGVALLHDLGLAQDLEPAATTAAAVWSRGRLRPFPPGHVMGVPGDLASLAATGILTLPGLLRVPLDYVLPAPAHGDDVSVGSFVGGRVGREVVDRLVEPLLGGVYAGSADLLSMEATLPQLAPAAREGGSLLAAVAAHREGAAVQGADGPVFGALRGGLGRLPGVLASASGADVRVRTTVRGLERTASGWRLTLGPTRSPERLDADAVVVAVPATAAARLLADVAATASDELGEIEQASVAIVTLVFPSAAFPRPLVGSGFLVPPAEGLAVKAVTFSSAKWHWVHDAAPGLVVLRVSLGRLGETAVLQRDDDDLAALAVTELAGLVGVRGAPLATRVSRWGGALPQYGVGHRARVARLRASVAQAPGLAVCGATYDGVGIPACVASAQAAADRVLQMLAPRGRMRT